MELRPDSGANTAAIEKWPRGSLRDIFSLSQYESRYENRIVLNLIGLQWTLPVGHGLVRASEWYSMRQTKRKCYALRIANEITIVIMQSFIERYCFIFIDRKQLASGFGIVESSIHPSSIWFSSWVSPNRVGHRYSGYWKLWTRRRSKAQTRPDGRLWNFWQCRKCEAKEKKMRVQPNRNRLP